jgi:hypothetical protein
LASVGAARRLPYSLGVNGMSFRFTCRSCGEVHEGIPTFAPGGNEALDKSGIERRIGDAKRKLAK